MKVRSSTIQAFAIMASLILSGCVTSSPIKRDAGCVYVKWSSKDRTLSIHEKYVDNIDLMKEWIGTVYYGVNLDLESAMWESGTQIRRPQLSRSQVPAESSGCTFSPHNEYSFCVVVTKSLEGTSTELTYLFEGALDQASQSVPLVSRILEEEVLGCQ